MAKAKKNKLQKPASATKEGGRKSWVSQAEVPRYTVQEAARVPTAIVESCGSQPTKPLHVAGALDLSVNSSNFRMLTGASAAYGLTNGSYASATISLTALGKRVADNSSEADRQSAMRESFLKPRAVGEFLRKLADTRLPKEAPARHLLEEIGVPADSADATYKLIVKGATELGLIREQKGNLYFDLDGVPIGTPQLDDTIESEPEGEEREQMTATPLPPIRDKLPPIKTPELPKANNRVFITHGKNSEIVNQLKELLTFGNFLPVVAKEHETVSKPVPDKVMDDMRSCSAAIIHVGKEIKLLDQEGKEHIFLNQNVLIEIGGALALYGRKFILLVERGATLPSNVQGLYEVRYEGDKLDYEATMKLLKAFNDFRQ